MGSAPKLIEAEKVARSENKIDDEPKQEQLIPWEEDGPWLNVPNHKWHRRAVYLLWEGYESSEIGAKVGVEARTVDNILSILRGQYPNDVPRRDQIRQKRLEKDTPN